MCQFNTHKSGREEARYTRIINMCLRSLAAWRGADINKPKVMGTRLHHARQPADVIQSESHIHFRPQRGTNTAWHSNNWFFSLCKRTNQVHLSVIFEIMLSDFSLILPPLT